MSNGNTFSWLSFLLGLAIGLWISLVVLFLSGRPTECDCVGGSSTIITAPGGDAAWIPGGDAAYYCTNNDEGRAVVVDEGRAVVVDEGRAVVVDGSGNVTVDEGRAVVVDKGAEALLLGSSVVVASAVSRNSAVPPTTRVAP